MAWRKKSVQVSNSSAGPRGQAERETVLAAGRGCGRPVQCGAAARGPVPILDPRDLHALHDRPLHLHVRVAPRTDLRVLAEVFVADVVPADKRRAAIDNDDLAMVAKVKLEAIGVAFARIEGADVHARGAQFVLVSVGQTVAADFVVEQVTAYAGARLRDERVLEPAPEAVVVDDVKLHEHVIARLLDALEDRAKRRLSVDQQLGVVAARGRKFREFFQQLRTRRLGLGRGSHREEIARELPLRVAQFRLSLAPKNDVALEV